MTDRQIIAAHEAGHAVMAYLLDRDVQLVSMHGPWGFPGSLDRHPPHRLGARLPLPYHSLSDDVVIWLAGPISAGLPIDFPARGEPQEARGDLDGAEIATRSITNSDEEYEALATALRLRTVSATQHPHFRALHDHLTEALLRDGQLNRDQARCELGRAELRYVNDPSEETDHGPTRTAT